MNNVTEKYKLTPNEIETRSIESERFKTEFNFENIKIRFQIDWTVMTKKIYSKKKKKLKESQILAKKCQCQLKELNKSATGKFYKPTVQNIFYFSREKIFIITNNKNILLVKRCKSQQVFQIIGFKDKNYLLF